MDFSYDVYNVIIKHVDNVYECFDKCLLVMDSMGDS